MLLNMFYMCSLTSYRVVFNFYVIYLFIVFLSNFTFTFLYVVNFIVKFFSMLFNIDCFVILCEALCNLVFEKFSVINIIITIIIIIISVLRA